MKRGRSSARRSTSELSSAWPDLRPLGSVTFSEPFLPRRSTTMPLSSTTRSAGALAAPSRAALDGRSLSPPSAQPMASSRLVLPCPLRPPMTVSPSARGSR